MKKDMINQYDKKGFRHGPWEYYYGNGQLSSKGEYKNGELHGPWEYYYDNGQLWRKQNFRNNRRYALLEYYSSNGIISFKGEFKKGKSIGLWYQKKYDKSKRRERNASWPVGRLLQQWKAMA